MAHGWSGWDTDKKDFCGLSASFSFTTKAQEVVFTKDTTRSVDRSFPAICEVYAKCKVNTKRGESTLRFVSFVKTTWCSLW